MSCAAPAHARTLWAATLLCAWATEVHLRTVQLGCCMLLRRALITCGRMLIRAQSSRTACYCLLDYFFPARMESTGTEWLPRGNKHAHSGICLGCADVPQQRAAAVTLGVVAGRARGALVDACAAYRARDSQARAWALRRANAHLPRIQARGIAWFWVAGVAHIRAPCPGVRHSAFTRGRGRIGCMVGTPADMTGRGRGRARAGGSVPAAAAGGPARRAAAAARQRAGRDGGRGAVPARHAAGARGAPPCKAPLKPTNNPGLALLCVRMCMPGGVHARSAALGWSTTVMVRVCALCCTRQHCGREGRAWGC